MSPEAATYAAWFAWAASWLAAAAWANRTEKRPDAGSQTLYRLLEYGGFALLLFHGVRRTADGAYQPNLTGAQLWSLSDDAKWAMVGAVVLGFLFCWWARLHLGRLWSGSVTRKESHRVVDSGPYAIVRHPIYTGVITASIATAAVRGTATAVVAVALIAIGYLLKGRLEERFLRSELGAAYDAYARRTPMLAPLLRF